MSKTEEVRLKTKTRFRFFKKVWRTLSFLVFALFIWLAYCYFILITNPFTDEVHEADAAIVLGAALWNDRPSPALRERLNYALAMYNEGIVSNIVVSGGKGTPDQNYSEAEGMFNYLVDNGVQKNDIIMEMHSTNTYENLLYTQAVLQKYNIDRVIIVSHTYHAYRINKIADFLGYDQYQVAGVNSTVLNKLYHYTREVLAYSKWVLNSFTLKLGIYID